jgi:CheY-like chemotaxis protein
MPGLDGWATLRAIREAQLTTAPAAIVSANAFDKGLDNDVGITPEDFIVKPVRVPELLDWLGKRLQLQWIEAERTAPGTSQASSPVSMEQEALPSLEALQELDDQVHAGYVRGVHKALDRIASTEPACEAFVSRLRQMARQFQLDALAQAIASAVAAKGAQSGPTSPMPSQQ